jgi:Glucosamine-6-phosphate isomerases/6-phosphogluconolactonase
VNDVELVVVDDAEELADAVAARLARAAEDGGNVVLTGGTTPEEAYEKAAERSPDWSKVDVWWGDERCVPPQDERSNYGMAKRTLFDRLAQPPRAVHRIKGELGKEDAAADYEAELDDTELDLVLLGVGPDGPDPLRSERDPLPALRLREGRRRGARLCDGAEPGHTGEPRPRPRRSHRCNPRSRCCGQAPCLTRLLLYVEVSAGQCSRR